jgi:hypothetical protein
LLKRRRALASYSVSHPCDFFLSQGWENKKLDRTPLLVRVPGELFTFAAKVGPTAGGKGGKTEVGSGLVNPLNLY